MVRRFNRIGEREGESEKVSMISAALQITGTLRSEGEIEFDGRIQGDIHCKSLILGQSAELNGNAVAEDITIKGRLIGSIRAHRAILQSMCHVEGEIFHQQLTLEEGAFFEGESRPSLDPIHNRTHIQLALLKARAGDFSS